LKVFTLKIEFLLEEVRNKIVIVTRYNSFPGIDLPIYSIVENINYNITYPQIGDDIYTLCVQDAYRLEEEDKWKAVKNLLTAQEMYNQEESAGVNVIAINFINTEKGILNDVATRLNNKLIYGDNNDDNNPNYVVQDEDLDTKLLDENRPFTLKQGIQYGWIITDFSDENVARRIYQTNKYNRCGIEFGYLICQDNKCCSQYGFCGVTDEYCDIGCQFDFGICNSNITQITSPDGTCGRFNGYSCEPGYCCSRGKCVQREFYNSKANILFALDDSNSMLDYGRIDKLNNALLEMANHMPDNIEMYYTTISFANNYTYPVSFTKENIPTIAMNDKSYGIDSLQSMLGKSYKFLYSKASRNRKKSILVLVTDGISKSSKDQNLSDIAKAIDIVSLIKTEEEEYFKERKQLFDEVESLPKDNLLQNISRIKQEIDSKYFITNNTFNYLQTEISKYLWRYDD